MTKIEIEVDSDDNGPTIVTPCHNRKLLHEYTAMPSSASHYVPQSFNEELYLPIKDVRVANLSDGAGSKPCYLYAEILPSNLKGGEKTNTNTQLALKIRQRGKPGDDCGHIIGAQLGGKMVEFNLFPQSMKINRGFGKLKILWRQGVEQVMAKWLTLPEHKHPKALFEIILFYTDTDYRDRPNKTKFVVTLKCDGEEEDDDGDGETYLDPVLKAQLLNELTVDVETELSAFEKINWHNFSCQFGNNYKQFARLLKEILIAILVEEPGYYIC